MDKELSKRVANKIKKREMIIDTAEKLFLEKDFEKTSMDDVSKEAGLTKRTIYQYFISKEDLFYAVALKGAKQFKSEYMGAIINGSNALDKIRLSHKAYCQFYIDNPGKFELMNYQPDNKLNNEASPNYHELAKLKNKLIEYYKDVVEEGKSDGSINKNLDTKKAVFFGFCSSMGLINMASEMGKSHIWQSEGLNESEFLLFSMDLLADALK